LQDEPHEPVGIGATPDEEVSGVRDPGDFLAVASARLARGECAATQDLGPLALGARKALGTTVPANPGVTSFLEPVDGFLEPVEGFDRPGTDRRPGLQI
jgi:hypothetical protein